MIVLYWNVRGIKNSDTQRSLKNLCYKYKPNILFIAEPMVSFSSIPPQFWLSISMNLVATNERDNLDPNLWTFSSIHLQTPTFVSVAPQHVTLMLQTYTTPMYISAIYASNNPIIRRSLWNDLALIKSSFDGPWLAIGDFNCLLGAHEKRGFPPPNARSCEDFQAMTDTLEFFHIPTT